jgi:hypothetical protein
MGAKESKGPGHLWILPLVAGVLWVFLGSIRLGPGGCNSTTCFGDNVPASPAATVNIMTGLGLEVAVFYLMVGGLALVVSAQGFRHGERQSWYVLLWFLLAGIVDVAAGDANPFAFAGIVLVGIALAATYRKFFVPSTSPA